jgi:ketosteroid isomerase-like protein
MSQENVEIVRRLMDAWNRQDLEGILALTHPEGEYVNAPNAVEPGTRRGHDEFVAVLRKQWEGLPGALQEIDRFHDRGDEIITEGRVLGRCREVTLGSATRSSCRGSSAMENSSGSNSSVLAPNFLTPSKPPGIRSRRCRRRTWKSSAVTTRPLIERTSPRF